MAWGFSLGVLAAFTSTLRSGPVAATGGLSVTVALSLTEVSSVLVAVTTTDCGAGYGVLYRPDALSVPGFRPLHDGQLSDQFTDLLKFPVLFTVAVNCGCVPITAEVGDTTIDVMEVWL